MLQYVCHCMNVSFETLPPSTSSNLGASVSQRDKLLKSVETLLLANASTDNEATKQINLVNSYFQNVAACFDKTASECPDFTAADQPDYINSFLKIKFPLLMGFTVQASCQPADEIRFKLSKCLICNTFTHIVAVTRRELVPQTLAHSDNNTSSTQHTHRHNLSHSAATLLESSESTSSSFTSSSYNVYLLVNSNQMKMVNDGDDLKRSESYSRIYDLVLDDRVGSVNDFDQYFGLDFQIKMESEIVKKVFLNRIEDAYVQQQQQQNSSDLSGQSYRNEEAFKLKFLDLVNSLLVNNGGDNATSVINATDNTSSVMKKKPNELKSARRVRRYDNENILSSSVFEMEELEGDSNDHFLSDEDEDDYASNEEETTTTNEDVNQILTSHLKTNVLKKRNSNVDDEHNNQLNSVKIPVQAARKYNKDLVSNKYSCSLPRDIPVMLIGGGRLSTQVKSSIVNNQQSSEEDTRVDNENHYYPMNSGEKLDNQKRHKSRSIMTAASHNSQSQAMSASNTNRTELNEDDSESSPINNDLYEGDDELFEDDHNNNVTKPERLGDDDETTTKDMGLAISNLASSIVIKDGRELFGGVPSRRVPINSISKSCFE